MKVSRLRGLLSATMIMLVVLFLVGVVTAANSDLVTIKANVNKDCAGTPWFVGEEKGFFKDEGIDFQDQGALDWSLQPAALVT
jgi:ABC-type nitrate/sulfonate/bicarbonate transport system substrate-binding protein